MSAIGLTPGTSGNASARIDGGFLITPTGVAYADMRPGDIVELDRDGNASRGQRIASSEWRFHKDILAHRPEVRAVLHAHAPFATALACHGRDIPAFHYMVAVGGGKSIRCAPYATFGTRALSDAAVAALDGRRACLLANHGLITVGDSLDTAFGLALEVEALAACYVRALAVGAPRILSDEQMRDVLERFKIYGQQDREEGAG